MENSRLENEIEFGKRISEEAENIWGWTTPAGKLRATRRANYFIEEGGYSASDKLLEIGCGTGIFTEKVFEATRADIMAIDISQHLLDQAKEKMPEVKFQIEDAMNLSFQDNAFNGVYGSSILHHLEMNKAMKEIHRVLIPGGKAVFAEPNMLNPQIFMERNVDYIRRKANNSPDETAIVRWEMKSLMKSIGYKNVRVFPYDFLHPATPPVIIGLVNGIGRIVEKIPLMKEIAGSVIIYGEK
ncbi:MAG: methyltransferase domain-containing protein [Bacteroidetes bacterium]|nr:methyltransferase domain-containing protein [Bacteroidota bacterium]